MPDMWRTGIDGSVFSETIVIAGTVGRRRRVRVRETVTARPQNCLRIVLGEINDRKTMP
jgi:hypothetical protein